MEHGHSFPAKVDAGGTIQSKFDNRLDSWSATVAFRLSAHRHIGYDPVTKPARLGRHLRWLAVDRMASATRSILESLA